MIRKRIVVNFLHYVKGLSVEEAEKLANENYYHIECVFDLLGDEVMFNILKCIKNDQEEEKDE